VIKSPISASQLISIDLERIHFSLTFHFAGALAVAAITLGCGES